MVTIATFTALINQLLPEPHAGLLAGILFGAKAALSKELVAGLTTTGTLHIVALSGMNITILAGLVNMTLLRFIKRRVASLVTIMLIVGFIFFVGPSPSIIRAGIMGAISLLAIVSGRQTWGLLSWMLAISTMILLNPSWITDLSFQLSALATLGMILFGGKIASPEVPQDSLFLFWNIVEDNLRLTLSAQVFTIPLIFLHFHRISLISPITNLLIGWV
ncbi:ComEC/Rec2 family competence protein, partial [Candidatus Gottesmanbacteria bacterium]|nr:ComEC/Rec2 family competence protein [Candidatus Gottesmanbacteria bacterium]